MRSDYVKSLNGYYHIAETTQPATNNSVQLVCHSFISDIRADATVLGKKVFYVPLAEVDNMTPITEQEYLAKALEEYIRGVLWINTLESGQAYVLPAMVSNSRHVIEKLLFKTESFEQSGLFYNAVINGVNMPLVDKEDKE
jgi:hypothetical protein